MAAFSNTAVQCYVDVYFRIDIINDTCNSHFSRIAGTVETAQYVCVLSSYITQLVIPGYIEQSADFVLISVVD